MICNDIQNLINYSIRNGLIEPSDEIVVRNRIMEIFRLRGWETSSCLDEKLTIDEILCNLVEYACENGICDDTNASKDLFDTKLMGAVTPYPREVIREFDRRYQISPKEATDWYYDFSKNLNYVRAGRIAKDLKWKYESEFGTLDITINRSKPEKDPRDIAAAGAQKSSSVYPKCQLCPENAGFAGTLSHPARQNLRPVPVTVHGEKWQLQYSPYGYYNEHCIVFNEHHIPMKIDESVFEKLFDILDIFPHYFIGSNADLPIVGGSILSHEHFQGGNYTFAMAMAPEEHSFTLEQFPDTQFSTVKWAMSVIRAKSRNRHELSKACTLVLNKWRSYSDPDVGIFAETDGVPHNTITPIARMDGDFYECDLVLRNNMTSSERPLGVFHPNPSLHHIKKENIGLIEVMGLAVLPARLANELETLKNAMLAGDKLDKIPEIASHAEWAKGILLRHPEFAADNAEQILRDEVGAVFEQVLLDAGVFKRDAAGQNAFSEFISTLTEKD